MFFDRVNQHTAYDIWRDFLTNRVLDIFTVKNMPRDMEIGFKIYLLLGGRCAFFQYNNKMTCQWFTTGGKISVYPTYYNGIIANPAITNPPDLDFDPDTGNAVPVYLNTTDSYLFCDTFGFTPYIDQTAHQLADNTISIENLQFIKRLPTVFTARTDVEKTALELMLSKIKQGLKSIVARVPLNDSVKRLDGGQGTALLQEFTEYQQYILGNFYQTIGVSCPWNMKRERVTSTESNQNIEVLRYNTYRLFNSLEDQIRIVNDTFGTGYEIIFNIDKVREEQREEEQKNGSSETNRPGGEVESSESDDDRAANDE